MPRCWLPVVCVCVSVLHRGSNLDESDFASAGVRMRLVTDLQDDGLDAALPLAYDPDAINRWVALSKSVMGVCLRGFGGGALSCCKQVVSGLRWAQVAVGCRVGTRRFFEREQNSHLRLRARLRACLATSLLSQVLGHPADCCHHAHCAADEHCWLFHQWTAH